MNYTNRMNPNIALATLATVILSAASVSAKPAAKPASVTVVVVGDVMLNRSKLEVRSGGVIEGSSVLPWSEMSKNILGLIDGDLNFMNLETVVTERNDLRPGDKRQKEPYLFRTHPKGVEHLLDIGFNLVSAANNHAYDYGEEGAKDTVRHLQKLTEDNPKAVYAGIGLNNQEAGRPATKLVRGLRVAFSSIGIVTSRINHHRAGPDKAGTLSFRHKEDWDNALGQIEGIKAGLKLLSIHYGDEREIKTDKLQRTEYRRAIDSHDVDMVISHHAHVARGIELHRGKLIFYGLGNFLIRGAANMAKNPTLRTCCDFGLLAKVHMMRDGAGYRVAAVEAVPITNMHRIPKRLAPAEAGKRVQVLNVLAESLDNAKIDSIGMRFAVRKDGSGLYCAPEAAKSTESIRTLCADYQGPSPVSQEVRRRVQNAPDPKKSRRAAKKVQKANKTRAAKRRRKAKAAKRRRSRRKK